MLFVYAANVDVVWAKVAGATAEGTLGCTAKVATLNDADGEDSDDDGGGGGDGQNKGWQAQGQGGDVRVICVYTADCEDVEEVKRVCLRLQEMGLAGEEVKAGGPSLRGGAESRKGKDMRGGGGAKNQAIYYKCDAWTHLGLKGGNRWALKASMYSSREMLGQGVEKRPWAAPNWRKA